MRLNKFLIKFICWGGKTVRLGKRTRFQCKTYSGGITNKATVFIYSENKRAYIYIQHGLVLTEGNGKNYPLKLVKID